MTDFVEELAGLIRGRGTVAMTDRGPVRVVPTHTLPRRCARTVAVIESQRKLVVLGCASITVEVDAAGTLVRGTRGEDVLQVFHAYEGERP